MRQSTANERYVKRQVSVIRVHTWPERHLTFRRNIGTRRQWSVGNMGWNELLYWEIVINDHCHGSVSDIVPICTCASGWQANIFLKPLPCHTRSSKRSKWGHLRSPVRLSMDPGISSILWFANRKSQPMSFMTLHVLNQVLWNIIKLKLIMYSALHNCN